MSEETPATNTGTDDTKTGSSEETTAVDPLIKAEEKPAETPPAEETGDETPDEGEETEEKPSEEEKEEKPAREGAPEKYEAFTVPEGVKIDDEVNKSFTDIAKKHDLSQPASQEFIDLFVDVQQNLIEDYAEQLKAQHVKQVNDWAEEAKTHPDIGGADIEVNKAIASKGLNKFFNEKAIKTLTDYGLLHNPDIVAGLMKVGKKISTDNMETGSGATVKEETFEKLTDIFPQPPVAGAT